MASKARLSLLLLSAVMASLVAGSSAGVYHIVGASKGWQMAPTKTYYAEWAHTRNISISDKLMFLYRSGAYNIVEVPTKELFDQCSMHNISNRYQNGPTIIELTEPGTRYYFCGVGKHCEDGQKVAINVSAVPEPLPPEDEQMEDDKSGEYLFLYGSSAGTAGAGAGAVLLGLAACLASAASLLF